MKLHAFVAMPFGSKPGPDGQVINWALLGRVDKDVWIAAWRRPDRTPGQMREDAAYEDALLRALQKLTKPEDQRQPRQVILFSGHMLDEPGRTPARFPPEKESIAAQKIAEALDQLGAGPDDLALAQGACGGDLLFTEACLHRGVQVHWLQPFSEPEFIEKSVVCNYEAWRPRYLDARAKLAAPIRSAPDALGPPPPHSAPDYPYERCNLWLLYTALAYGADKVHFVCLWNGQGGDGPGGTAHMYNEVKRRTGRVTWIDTRKLW